MHEGLAENDAIPVTRMPEKGHFETPVHASDNDGFARRERTLPVFPFHVMGWTPPDGICVPR